MTTPIVYQGISILVEVHRLPTSDSTTYGILFAVAGTDIVLGFVTCQHDMPSVSLVPTEVLLSPKMPTVAMLLVEQGYLQSTERFLQVDSSRMPIYTLTAHALAQVVP